MTEELFDLIWNDTTNQRLKAFQKEAILKWEPDNRADVNVDEDLILNQTMTLHENNMNQAPCTPNTSSTKKRIKMSNI
ncbi:unnamed protein product [Brachionus calyciflorus]|uniref:Uncharacterized protein n=1 Tax=Brachionus calyciflorus TaxID=104777 RepID=A0A814GQ65_9BILA|nr:unnamed protein product [Brachionus calyciflorus]